MPEQETSWVIEEIILGVERGSPWPDEASITFRSGIDRQHKGVRFGLDALPLELVPGWIMMTNLETGEVGFKPPKTESE